MVVKIRGWELSDATDLALALSNKKIQNNLRDGLPYPYTEQDGKDYISAMLSANENDTFAFAITIDNKVIGSIGLHHRKPDETLNDLKQREIGYVLNPNYWGKGFIPEAVNCLLNYGFNELNLDLIWCGHFDFNNNSKRVNEKCGFNYQFTKREKRKLLDNQEVNTLYYNLSKAEYLSKQTD